MKETFKPMKLSNSNKGKLTLISKNIKFKTMKKDEINLCNDCYFCIATCKSEIEFGSGRGRDNVVKCNIYEPIKNKLHEKN